MATFDFCMRFLSYLLLTVVNQYSAFKTPVTQRVKSKTLLKTALRLLQVG
jgi:hypothetical protein